MTRKVRQVLTAVKRADGSSPIKIYGGDEGLTSITTFNFVDESGKGLDYRGYVESAASYNVAISGGCHGVFGSCYKQLGVGENDADLDNVGALRVSVGWATTESDIIKLKNWIMSVVDK
jgi:selenocysteine lyase/cysteine desulfurase